MMPTLSSIARSGHYENMSPQMGGCNLSLSLFAASIASIFPVMRLTRKCWKSLRLQLNTRQAFTWNSATLTQPTNKPTIRSSRNITILSLKSTFQAPCATNNNIIAPSNQKLLSIHVCRKTLFFTMKLVNFFTKGKKISGGTQSLVGSSREFTFC